MSKFVLTYCVLALCSALTAAQPEKAVTPRTFSPKAQVQASKDFYSGMDYFTNSRFEKAYNSFLKASKAPGITVEEKDVATYNAALSLERSKKYSKALDLYNSIQKNDKDKYYRISACCHELKKWDCVLAGLKNWKNQSGALSLVEEFEFRVRMGSAYVSLFAYKDGVPYLETAIKAFSEKQNLLLIDAANKEYTKEKINALGLWALDDLATADKIIGQNINIPTSNNNDETNSSFLNSLKNQVGLKAYYYLKAQDTYLQMVQFGDIKTASKGLFMIGDLYQDAYKAFMDTGIPQNIKDKKLEKEYSEELKKSLKPLLEKAKIAHNKNIELEIKYKIHNEWVQKSKTALTKIKD